MNCKSKTSKKLAKTAANYGRSGNSEGAKKLKDEDVGDGAYVSKVDLDLDLETDMLNLIRSHVHQRSLNCEKRASYRLTKRRITEIYNTLLEAGFNQESIESAMGHCLPIGGDLVSTLDWLCLNTKDENLPENFSRVLKVEEQKLKPKFDLVQNVDNNYAVSFEKITKQHNAIQDDTEKSMKDWILRYAEENDDGEEDGDDNSGSNDNDDGSNDNDGGSNNANNDEQKKKENESSESDLNYDEDLNGKFITKVAKYLDLKYSCDVTSEEGIKDLETLLGEMQAVTSRPGFDIRNHNLLNVRREMKCLERSTHGDDMDVANLFDNQGDEESCGSDNTKVKSSVSEDDELRNFSYTRQQWTGKSPKQFLNDWMKKKMQKCSVSFGKVDAGGGKWRSKCNLKRPAKEGGDLSVCPDILCSNMKDAEHLASTLLLYNLCKDKDLHLLLPPPYKDVWLDWKRSEREKVQAINKENTRPREEFVDKLFNKISTTSNIVATKTSNIDDDDDNDDYDSWENRISYNDMAPSSLSSPSSQTTKKQKLLSDCKQLMESNKKSKQYALLLKDRQQLPIYIFKQQILDIFRDNSVLIVAGETGSGKSTQVPQFIVEELLSASSSSSLPPFIVCTEPRRISAVSLAHRVSTEMGETGGPGSPFSLIGYQIRSEVKKSAKSRLLFCTTGVLLRRMQEDLNIEDVSCVIVDEVHERDLNTDVLLIHLLELLSTNLRSKLKVILMSATLDSKKFSDYFFNCPVISVQGRSHHVEVLHVENVLELTKYQLELDSPYSIPYEEIINEESTTVKIKDRGETNMVDVTWSREDIFVVDRSGLDPTSFSLRTRNTVTRMNHDLINTDLIVETLRWLFADQDKKIDDIGKEGTGCQSNLRGRDGSVLVFLPGLAAIEEVKEAMNSDPLFRNPNKFIILPLHSVLSSNEQSLVFSTPPPGVRKVVLSTNIAETGITIPDVVYVIDCGREKQKKYIESSRISQLRQVWISQASVRQRQGRAGRVRPGVCFRLYTCQQYSTMRPHSLPEMKRLPLQGLCLHVMKCYSKPLIEIFARAIDPPEPSAIFSAMSILQEVGACIGTTLTPLGHHLARLPLDARLGKILIYAGVLGCLEQASIMVSCMTEKSPFQSRLERSTTADEGKNQFNQYNSDQLATYLAVRRCLAQTKRMERKSYCKKHSLKFDVIKDIETMSRELQQLVKDCGLHSQMSDIFKHQPNLLKAFSSSSIDPSPHIVTLLKAVLVAGLYPNVGGLVVSEKPGRKKLREIYLGATGDVAGIHNSSVNKKLDVNGWIVYLNKDKQQNKVAVCETTFVNNISLLLFGGNIQVQHQQHVVMMDSWIKFKAPARVGVLIKEMRMMLDEFLNKKLHNPLFDISGEPVLPLLLRLLTSEK